MQVTLRVFVKELQQGLAQAAGQRSMQLGKGQCKDFEEYKKNVGYIAGLEAAIETADRMLRSLEDQAREGENNLPEMPPTGDEK